MRNDVHIRRATRADIELITAWQIAMAQETEGIILDKDTVTRGVTQVFDTPSIGYYLIAAANNDPAGCMLVLSEWSDWRAGTVLWLHSVYVEPSKRWRGCFKSLYQHIKDLVACDPTLRGIRLYVDKSNSGAAAVYESLGMSSKHYDLFEWMPPS